MQERKKRDKRKTKKKMNTTKVKKRTTKNVKTSKQKQRLVRTRYQVYNTYPGLYTPDIIYTQTKTQEPKEKHPNMRQDRYQGTTQRREARGGTPKS